MDLEMTCVPARMRAAPLLLLTVLIALAPLPCRALELSRIEGPGAVVLCEPRLVPEGRVVLGLYPSVRKGLEAAFGWEVDFRPVIVLAGTRKTFRDMAGNDSFVAFAIPGRQVIAIDHTRMGEHPFTLEITLRHELCHLLLHRRMGGTGMPRWLDEGIAQWISGGIPELAAIPRESLLTSAALTGSLLSLASLDRSFPRDDRGLALAYGQSRSVVEYIVRNYGRNGVLNILEAMRKGADLQGAIEVSLMLTPLELEKAWRSEQLGLTALLAYLAVHLYTILFLLAALLTFWGYIRAVLRKRRLREEPEDAPGQDPNGPQPW